MPAWEVFVMLEQITWVSDEHLETSKECGMNFGRVWQPLKPAIDLPKQLACACGHLLRNLKGFTVLLAVGGYVMARQYDNMFEIYQLRACRTYAS